MREGTRKSCNSVKEKTLLGGGRTLFNAFPPPPPHLYLRINRRKEGERRNFAAERCCRRGRRGLRTTARAFRGSAPLHTRRARQRAVAYETCHHARLSQTKKGMDPPAVVHGPAMEECPRRRRRPRRVRHLLLALVVASDFVSLSRAWAPHPSKQNADYLPYKSEFVALAVGTFQTFAMHAWELMKQWERDDGRN